MLETADAAYSTFNRPGDWKVAEILAASGMFADARTPARAFAKIMLGRELGIGPVSSQLGIHFIDGKLALSANLIARNIRASDHYDFRVLEWTEQRCVIEFTAMGERIGESVFTWADAEKSGKAKGKNYQQHPKAMLFARALTQGARAFTPDAFGGAPVYTADELGLDEVPDLSNVNPNAGAPLPPVGSFPGLPAPATPTAPSGDPDRF